MNYVSVFVCYLRVMLSCFYITLYHKMLTYFIPQGTKYFTLTLRQTKVCCSAVG